MQVANNLIPIFAVIALGIVLRRRGFLTSEMTQGFNSFAYYFALPLFLFHSIGTAETVTGQANMIIFSLLSATIGTLSISWMLARWLKFSPPTLGAFVQASYRGNLAFIGLPLIFFTLQDVIQKEQAELQAAVLLALPPVVIFYNASAVAILEICSQNSERRFVWKSVLKNIAVNPLLVACLAGILIQQASWTVPAVIARTCEVIGQAAFPLALVGIGSQMAAISISGRWLEPLGSGLLKSVVCPALGAIVGMGCGLRGLDLQALLILCAVPTAVSGYVLADQMKADSELAASSVVIGTALSLLPLSVLLIIPFGGH